MNDSSFLPLRCLQNAPAADMVVINGAGKEGRSKQKIDPKFLPDTNQFKDFLVLIKLELIAKGGIRIQG
jgi:hypothetical protein